jgi:hypothetical protein
MIPHHHHGAEEYALSFQSGNSHHHHSDDFDLMSHYEEYHQHETEKKQQQNFPFHQHFSEDEDFDYIRINLKKDSDVTCKLVTILFKISDFKITPPPEIDITRFTDKPFLITAIFEPGATGLRGPPSIA